MKKLKNLGLFFFGFFLIIVLFELLLTYGGIMIPIQRVDQNKGERYCPNIICCSIFFCEGFGLASTNADGWFGKEHKVKEPDDISVAVIGNSYAVSRQVFYRDNFLSVAENLMNKKLLSNKVSFYNYGIEGLRIKELLYLKEKEVSCKNPDYILVLLKNGIFNLSKNHYSPHFEYENGAFKLDTSFKQVSFVKYYNKFELIAKSSVFLLSYKLKNHFSRSGEIFFDKFYMTSSKMEKKEPSDEETGIADSLNVVDKAILKELTVDKRVIFVLDVSPDLAIQLKSLVPSSRLIDLHEPLLKMKKQGVDPYYWPVTKEVGHWNIPAHKIIGEEIAKQLIGYLN